MARYRDLCGQAGPVFTGMPFPNYSCSIEASGCRTASGSAPSVLLCLEAMKVVSEGACLSASNVSQAVDARYSALDSTGG